MSKVWSLDDVDGEAVHAPAASPLRQSMGASISESPAGRVVLSMGDVGAAALPLPSLPSAPLPGTLGMCTSGLWR